jgi:hypothetical protein
MLTNILVALLGLIFVTLAKMQSVKKDFESAKQVFVLKKFLNGEAIALAMSVTIIIIMALTVEEWINVSPKVADYVAIIFGLGGAIGSWAALLFLGKSKDYIRKVVEFKTKDTPVTDEKPPTP